VLDLWQIHSKNEIEIFTFFRNKIWNNRTNFDWRSQTKLPRCPWCVAVTWSQSRVDRRCMDNLFLSLSFLKIQSNSSDGTHGCASCQFAVLRPGFCLGLGIFTRIVAIHHKTLTTPLFDELTPTDISHITSVIFVVWFTYLYVCWRCYCWNN